MRQPSVLFINRVYAPARGATGRLLSDLAQGFAKDGWDTHVITTGTKAESGTANGVRVTRIRTDNRQTIFNYLAVWLKLFGAARKYQKTDLIVTMTDPPLLVVAGRMISKANRSTHIHWCQDVYPDLFPVIGLKVPGLVLNWMRKLSLYAIRACARIIVIGECMAERLGELDFDQRRLAIIPNWPDREFQPASQPPFHPEPKPNPEKPLIVNNDPKFRVLYAGNIGRVHPVSAILDAAALLQLSNPEIEFLFVGEGPGHERLAQERLRRGLENIRFLPFQPDFKLSEMMQSGDLHLISLKNDAAGLAVPSKLYSALAANRPSVFVGPEKSETARVLEKFGAGTTIDPKNPKELAEEIIAYRMDGSKWFEAHKGAKKAAEEFNAENSIANWIACARAAIRYPSG